MTINLDKVAKLHQQDRDLLETKNRAYGNTGLRQTGLTGIATRIIDKANRLHRLATDRSIPYGDESIDDTLKDISNYGVLGRMLDDDSLRNRPSTVYLAGPIDLAPPSMQTGWRTLAKEVFGQYNVATFDPNAAWVGGGINKQVKETVMNVDKFAVWACEMVLAYLPHDIPTLGTIREIEFAKERDRRVVVASPWAETSAFSADLECYDTVPEALCAILEIELGEYNQFVSLIFNDEEASLHGNGRESQSESARDSNREFHTRPLTRDRSVVY